LRFTADRASLITVDYSRRLLGALLAEALAPDEDRELEERRNEQ
jgi:hypothetical protein